MGSEQTSCFIMSTDGFETEITGNNHHRKIFSEQNNPKRKLNKNNDKNMIYANKYKTYEQINSSIRTNSSNSSSQLIYQSKIIAIQKYVRLFIAKKKFKERLELLMNIIELDNTVNLIKDKATSAKILLENKGEQLWKELVSKKKIIPFEDTPYYRKHIKFYRPNKYLISTQLIYIDKYKNDNLYKGTWTLEKVFHGFGTFYISGNKYEGFWIFGKINGECRYFLKNNEYFIGNFVNGQAQGKGKYYHNDGTVYEGDWKNDQPSGWGKELFIDGSSFEGIFENGFKKKGRFKWNDGSYYDGEIKNNSFEGYGIFHWKEGREYKGSWKGGKMWGFGEIKYIDGAKYEGNFVNGKREGYGKYIWNSNKYYEGGWKKGKQDGKGYFYNKGNGVHGIWKDGNILNGNKNMNISNRFASITSYNETNISVNKSNYSGLDKIFLKIKDAYSYKNINYSLNGVTKKRTIDIKSKNKTNKKIGNTRTKNKSTKDSSMNDFSIIKRKIQYYCNDKDRSYYNRTNTDDKTVNNITSNTNYNSNNLQKNKIQKKKMNQIKKLNHTQENSKIKWNSREKKTKK